MNIIKTLKTQPFTILLYLHDLLHDQSAAHYLSGFRLPKGTRVVILLVTPLLYGEQRSDIDPNFRERQAHAIEFAMCSVQSIIESADIRVERIVCSGHQAETVLNTALEVDATLIAIAEQERTEESQLPISRVVQKVTKLAQQSVLLVRTPAQVKHIVFIIDDSPKSAKALNFLISMPFTKCPEVTVLYNRSATVLSWLQSVASFFTKNQLEAEV